MPRYASDVSTGRRSVDQPNNVGVLDAPVFFTFPVTAILNDILALAELAPGVKLVDYDVIAPQLDSNGAPTLAFSIGVENTGGTDLATVYETGLIPGRTANGSVARCTNANAMAADASVSRKIALKVTTAAATAAMAGKTILVVLHCQA